MSADLAAADRQTLQRKARQFGLSLEMVPAAAHIDPASGPIAALLFHAGAVDCGMQWIQACRTLRHRFPDARLIPVHRFSEPLDWEQLSAEGAWHSLWLPLDDHEVTQCLGFIWAAENRCPATPAGPAVRLQTRPLSADARSRLLPCSSPVAA